MGADRAVTADSCYVTQNEQKNTQNNVIEGDIRREITIATDQKHQKTFEAAANMICQLKQRGDRMDVAIIICCLKKGHDELSIPDEEEVAHVSSYPLIEYMGFDTDISCGVKKMRAATLLEWIVRLYQCNRNTLNFFHTNSKYGHLVVRQASYDQEPLSRAAIDKVWIDEILLCSSVGKE